MAKENTALWLMFIFMALIIKGGLSSWRNYLRFEIPLIGIAAIYFVAVVGIVMPAFGNSGQATQLARYSYLGDSPAAIAKNIVIHPQRTLGLMTFESPTGEKKFLGAKTELQFMVLASGGIALLFAPYYLVALIPIYLQKFLPSDAAMWGINFQYSIEFVPILSLVLTDSLRRIKRRRFQVATALLVVVMSFAATSLAIYIERIMPPNPVNANFFSISHYQTPLDLSAIYGALDLIPEDAPVSASPAIAPHLSSRDKLYSFPVVNDAEYLVLLADSQYYPLDRQGFEQEMGNYRNSPDFEVIYDNNNLTIFRRTS